MILFPGEQLQLVDPAGGGPAALEILEHERANSYTIQISRNGSPMRYPYVQLVWVRGETFLMLQGAKEKGHYEVVAPIRPRRQAFRDLNVMRHNVEVLLEYVNGAPHTDDYIRQQLRDLRARLPSVDGIVPGLLPLNPEKT